MRLKSCKAGSAAPLEDRSVNNDLSRCPETGSVGCADSVLWLVGGPVAATIPRSIRSQTPCRRRCSKT
jgi:hypothetical protein